MVDKFALQRMMNAIRAELEKPEGRKDFEEWYLNRYGKPYEWKRQQTEE